MENVNWAPLLTPTFVIGYGLVCIALVAVGLAMLGNPEKKD